MNLTPNTILANKYKLTRPLGEGGMGAVWVADHLHLDRQVAIKVISTRVLSEPTVRDRFETEARATAKVESPHVVQVLDFDYTEEGHPFLVLELLVGETLEQRISREGVLSVEEARELLEQTTHALAEAHRSQILHRDIKADNLFLIAKDGLFVKLLDFGIAIRSDRASRSDSAVNAAELSPIGTPLYMSPEQTLALGGIDERSDLYSLAVCMYYALTGDFPYCADSLAILAVNQQREEFTLPSVLRKDLGPALDAFFMRALAFHAEDRFSSAEKMCEAFGKACDRRTEMGEQQKRAARPLASSLLANASEPTRSSPQKSSARRRRRGFTFAVAAAAAVTGYLLIPRAALPKMPSVLSSAAAFVATRIPAAQVLAATENAPQFAVNRPNSPTSANLVALPLVSTPPTATSRSPGNATVSAPKFGASAGAAKTSYPPVLPHEEWPAIPAPAEAETPSTPSTPTTATAATTPSPAETIASATPDASHAPEAAPAPSSSAASETDSHLWIERK